MGGESQSKQQKAALCIRKYEKKSQNKCKAGVNPQKRKKESFYGQKSHLESI
jgi:hypothetical protein